jgi:hypothetical protein
VKSADCEIATLASAQSSETFSLDVGGAPINSIMQPVALLLCIERNELIFLTLPLVQIIRFEEMIISVLNIKKFVNKNYNLKKVATIYVKFE